MKKGLCKVGFPIEALEKYTGLLIETGYSFVIYDFNSEKEDLVIIISYLGKRLNYEVSRNRCFTCEKNKDKKVDKYIRALIKMYEQEEKEIREEKQRKKQEKEKKELEEIEKIERKIKDILLKLGNGE